MEWATLRLRVGLLWTTRSRVKVVMGCSANNARGERSALGREALAVVAWVVLYIGGVNEEVKRKYKPESSECTLAAVMESFLAARP